MRRPCMVWPRFCCCARLLVRYRLHAHPCARAEPCVALGPAYENKMELAPLARKIERYRKPAQVAFRVDISSQLQAADVPLLSRL